MATRWRWLSVRDPVIQIDQGGAQQWPIIGPIEGVLAAVSLPCISILRWEGAYRMLRPTKVVNAHGLWYLQVTAAGDIDVHQGTVATPVLG